MNEFACYDIMIVEGHLFFYNKLVKGILLLKMTINLFKLFV